ncbi:GNAT family N-acetyltransferase [Mucilaginibacter ginkgonis]|uniref:GNAT family N-acetyltransferase n=1 Tax=Mucilaginibacter ginkgonis TaxID=2682091 RepID=A0A6I4I272_9SPHI|nr:GNAT family N-acetyltransferase [Mucilaginibacter ginkgonis]QQL50835.1 GNAT family N-acetyltransferase [Mucilaginibacter ginkgonis]
MVDRTIKVINSAETTLLDLFIANAGSSLQTFRYFQSRPYTVLNNHITTCLLMEGNEPVGYGHLDKDQGQDTVWLGIAVSEKHKGKGLGKRIMNYLIASAKTNQIAKLKLTVDDTNIAAIHLYQKFGFKAAGNVKDSCLLMELEVSHA